MRVLFLLEFMKESVNSKGKEMKKELIFELASAHRDKQEIFVYTFGSGEKVLAIVGSMRGSELQQLYIASQLVRIVRKIETEGKLLPNCQITIIPVVNSYSINIGKRFFTLDNTDINRMFPGYLEGETTQRIAGKLFDFVKEYEVGINLTSFYMRGEFAPHVRTLQTGYEDRELGKKFGLKYQYIRETHPQETATLNYNWQIWGTKAFSLYAGGTSIIDYDSAKIAIDATLNFMYEMNWIEYKGSSRELTRVIDDKDLFVVKSKRAGIFYSKKKISESVKKGEILAEVIDPILGDILCEIIAPFESEVFYSHSDALIFENKIAYILLSKEL